MQPVNVGWGRTYVATQQVSLSRCLQIDLPARTLRSRYAVVQSRNRFEAHRSPWGRFSAGSSRYHGLARAQSMVRRIPSSTSTRRRHPNSTLCLGRVRDTTRNVLITAAVARRRINGLGTEYAYSTFAILIAKSTASPIVVSVMLPMLNASPIAALLSAAETRRRWRRRRR